jgi:hypothetical protein
MNLKSYYYWAGNGFGNSQGFLKMATIIAATYNIVPAVEINARMEKLRELM